MRPATTTARHPWLCTAGAVLIAGLGRDSDPSRWRAGAQDEAGREPNDTTAISDVTFPNNIAGEFTPAKGFDIAKTKIASLNVSFYGLFRYMNQMSGGQTFTDHLGRERTVKARNDLNWHRTFVWLTGFFYDPKFRYNISLWSLPTTQQTLLFGNLQYRFNKAIGVGVGSRPISPRARCRAPGPSGAPATGRWPRISFAAGSRPAFFVTGQPSTSSGIPPRSTPTSASSAPPPPTTRATWPTARAWSGGRAPASSVPGTAWATSSTTASWPPNSAPRPLTAVNPATRTTPRRPTPPRSSSPTGSIRSMPTRWPPG